MSDQAHLTTNDQVSDEMLTRFDVASNHPYECKCAICKEWWKACGPEMEDDDTPAGFGPFGDELP